LPEVEDRLTKRSARLERDLDTARRTMKDQQTRIAVLVRANARRKAEAIFDTAATAMRENPPSGFDTEYVSGFLRRQRARLVSLVADVLG
jgi:hypothetical protein